jgi:hypothetical protein
VDQPQFFDYKSQIAEVTMSKKFIFLLFGLLLFTLSCGSVADMISSQVSQVATEDQVEAAKRGQAIATYTLPQGFAERMAMGLMGFDMVFISDQPMGTGDQSAAQTIIILAKLPSGVAADDQAKNQLREALSQRTGNQSDMQTEQVETRQITINGQPAELIVEEGQTDKGETYRIMISSFTARDEKSPAMLLIAGPTAAWNEAAINQFINSMQ